MKSLSLARVLPVLDSFESHLPKLSRLPSLAHVTPRPELHVVEPSCSGETSTAFVDLAARDQGNWQEGYEAGVAVGRAQAQANILDHDVLLRDAVAAARSEWISQESERIALGVERALTHLQDEICTVAMRVLSQISDEAMRERSISEFCMHVATLLRDGQAGIVTVHAPADLIGQLQARLGAFASLEFIVRDTAEVWLRSGATMIETRFAAWQCDHFKGA